MSKLQNKNKDKKKILIHVDSNGHANLDSLPLRYCFNFTTNETLELRDCETWEKNQHKKNDGSFEIRFLVDAVFTKPDGKPDHGRFVLADHGRKHLNLVTVWKNDQEAEEKLSFYLKDIRKEGNITTEELIRLHDFYKNDEANTVSGLIASLIKIAEEGTKAAEEREAKVTEIAKRHLNEKHKLEDKLEEVEKVNEKQREEIMRLTKTHPNYDGSDVDISIVGKLKRVTKRKRKKSSGDVVNCVFLEFEEDHFPERKMDEIFDLDNAIYEKAQS